MDMNQYLSLFIDESNEHLQALNENLLNLEKNPSDLSIVQHIFRSAHTLKGMSATMRFEDLASLTHEMENVLDLVRNQKQRMTPIIFDALFKSLDCLETMIKDIAGGGLGRADVTPIIQAFNAIASADPAQSRKDGIFDVQVTLRDDCLLKAARAYMVLEALKSHGKIVKSSPSEEDILQEKFAATFNVHYACTLDEETLKQLIMNILEVESVRMTPMNRAETSDAGENEELPIPLQHSERSFTAEPKPQAPVSNRTIRVDLDRLDTLMNLFSELLIDRVRLEQLAGEIGRGDLSETIEHMSRVSTDLQNIVFKMRMVPVDTVFNRYPRMVRDLAKSLDKKVELVISGAGTELDRTVIDEIGDPLVHLLRNALDHGIETSAERIAAGKQQTGTIRLRAFHSGNNVFIEIEEDGRGIDRAKVLRTAIHKGIVNQEQAAQMSDGDVYHLLFSPGFSTADQISDISGRGVGLDVVRSKISSLGGNVAIQTRLGAGTTFSVQLPLTLSIISAMLVRLGKEKYAIPLSSILETCSVRQANLRRVHGNLMVDYRNSVISAVFLSSLLDCPRADDGTAEELEVVIIHKGDKMAALIIDEFIGHQEIVIKSLGKYLSGLFAISGATILGDGQVALIIDTNAIIV
jgi:two-component system chemotaxis sensor kinase CheA